MSWHLGWWSKPPSSVFAARSRGFGSASDLFSREASKLCDGVPGFAPVSFVNM